MARTIRELIKILQAEPQDQQVECLVVTTESQLVCVDVQKTAPGMLKVLSLFSREEQPKPSCLHQDGVTPSYEHGTCKACGAVRTGSHEDRWGVAKSTWFNNLAEAEFYKENGRLPE